MTDSEFHQLIDSCLRQIEQKLDDAIENMDSDVDYEIMAGVLTLTFENGSKIIINRQEPVHELWLATRENGFHFSLVDGVWRDNKTAAYFWDILEDSFQKQAGEFVNLRS